jgi:hypothetical protein
MNGIRDLNRVLGVLAVLTVVIVGWCVGGCSAKHAVGNTTDHAGFEFISNWFEKRVTYNTNGKTEIDEASYYPGNGTPTSQPVFKITNFKHEQDSATAAKYDAEKIEKTGVAQEWQVHWVKESWAGFTAWTHEIAPVLQLLASGKFVNTSSGFNIEVPGYGTLGKTKTTDASQVQSIIQSLASQANKYDKTFTANQTTQPANKEPE